MWNIFFPLPNVLLSLVKCLLYLSKQLRTNFTDRMWVCEMLLHFSTHTYTQIHTHTQCVLLLEGICPGAFQFAFTVVQVLLTHSLFFLMFIHVFWFRFHWWHFSRETAAQTSLKNSQLYLQHQWGEGNIHVTSWQKFILYIYIHTIFLNSVNSKPISIWSVKSRSPIYTH